MLKIIKYINIVTIIESYQLNIIKHIYYYLRYMNQYIFHIYLYPKNILCSIYLYTKGKYNFLLVMKTLQYCIKNFIK